MSTDPRAKVAQNSTPDPVAFVGGFGGDLMGGDGTHVSDYKAEFARANPVVSTSYFSWDDSSGVQDWLTNTAGPLTVVCQSAGCGTVANALAATNMHVANLVTVDPFSVNPFGNWSFNTIAGLTKNWVDISEAPSPLQIFAHWWGSGPNGVATTYLNNEQITHGDFFGSMRYINSANKLPAGLNWPTN